MRIERDDSNSFTLAARPTLTPSYWLLRFNRVNDPDVEQLCIADAIASPGMPVLLTFDEVAASPDAQDGEVTLNPGQWRLRVYEQSTTSLNYSQSEREVFDVLVEVVGAAAPDPEPTDPCAGSGGSCDPFTVLRDGSPYDVVEDPCGKSIDVPSDCPPCDPELGLRLNQGRVFKTLALDCGFQESNLVVTYPDGTPVGEWNSLEGRIEVPACPDASCSDPANVALLDDDQGHAHGGTYKPTGTAGGKDLYTSSQHANRELYYTGTAWELTQTGGGGHSHTAAPGNEDYPWEADWSGTGVTVEQGTLADLCCDGEGGGTVTIRNAADDATIDTVTAPDDWIIPGIRIPYVDTDGDPQYFVAYVDGITGGELTVTEPGGGPPPVPRFIVYATDGVTVVGYRDITDATLNLPQSRIKYKDADDASEVSAPHDTVYEDGTLRPDYEVPRRELKNLNGTGMGVYVSVGELIGNSVPNAPIPLKFAWAAGDADTYTWTVTDDEAGTYDTYTQDGGSGTLTYSKNGGSFTALTGSITLAVSDTIVVRRTTSTSNGWVKWAP